MKQEGHQKAELQRDSSPKVEVLPVYYSPLCATMWREAPVEACGGQGLKGLFFKKEVEENKTSKCLSSY